MSRNDNQQTSAKGGGVNSVAEIMAALLPIHRAVTIEWLVDAAATAAERLGALLLMLPTDSDMELVRLLADHVACAAVNLRNTEAARSQGVTDVVRSVYDERKLETDLQRELGRAARYKRQVSIAVIEATNLGLLREQFGAFL